MNTLGDNLKKYRLKADMTQGEVAEEIHKARETYSRYETGTLMPDVETLIELADIFQVSLDLLTGRTTTMETYAKSFLPGYAVGDKLGKAINRKRATNRRKKKAATSGDGAKSGS